MNRIEIVGLFTAMKTLVKKGHVDELEDLIDTVLEEAKTKNKSNPKED